MFQLYRSSLPKKDIYFPLEPIEAECKVFGMPVPVVEWVHNSRVIHVIFFTIIKCYKFKLKILPAQNNDFEISTSMNHCSGVATVVARLIIKPHHVKPGTIKTFTCVGRSGSRTVKASSNEFFNRFIKRANRDFFSKCTF